MPRHRGALAADQWPAQGGAVVTVCGTHLTRVRFGTKPGTHLIIVNGLFGEFGCALNERVASACGQGVELDLGMAAEPDPAGHRCGQPGITSSAGEKPPALPSRAGRKLR